MDPVEPRPATPDEPSAGDNDHPGPTRVVTDQARRRRRTRHVVEWVLLVGGALVIALLIKTFLFQAFYIPSESMVPTLEENDRVLVNKLSYRLHDVHRGDIVVFEAPEGQAQDGVNDLVKRVVGLPGDTVEGRDGRVFVNGEPLEEDYLPDGTETSTFGPQEVPAGSYFVMGDNRQASRDSRFFGAIPEDDIVGRVFVRIWPPTRIGFM
jgi:signal peptidase I